jgi:hypothetical protein
MDMQLQRIMLNLNQCRDNLEKYVFLSALSDRNLTAFYKVGLKSNTTAAYLFLFLYNSYRF